ncbi:uncharacterized protein LOC119073575 [Bradysia coprophila]|uniref:uncharacterized protein LOC119073575 n=1 Tax=Bradysia coprophila TaxID=38358 RepID=UPI00187D80C4|nr:uncharacterized protein LOC119073575 [Bradysia coprophila]
MKRLMLLLVLGLLCKTIDAGKTTRFSVVKTWQSFQSNGSYTCTCDDDPWKEALQDHYDKCKETAGLLKGDAFQIADTTLNSFEKHVTKLIYFSNSDSPIVQSGATRILKLLGQADNMEGSGANFIAEYVKVIPLQISEYIEIAKNLSEHIGDEQTKSFTKAVQNFGTVLTKFMKEFTNSCLFLNCKRSVDFTPVLEVCQKLLNTLALIDQTLSNDCGTAVTQKMYDSVLVLHLLTLDLLISVPAVHSCVLGELNDRNYPVSKSVKSCSISFEQALVKLTNAVSTVVSSSTQSIKNLMTVFLEITSVLNAAVESVLGLANALLLTVDTTVINLVKGLLPSIGK